MGFFPLLARRMPFLVACKALGSFCFFWKWRFGTSLSWFVLLVLDHHGLGVSEDTVSGRYICSRRHLSRLFAARFELEFRAFADGCRGCACPCVLCVGVGCTARLRIRGCGRLELLSFVPIVHFVGRGWSQIFHWTIVEPETAPFFCRWSAVLVFEAESTPFFAFTETASAASCITGGRCEFLSFGPIVHLVGTRRSFVQRFASCLVACTESIATTALLSIAESAPSFFGRSTFAKSISTPAFVSAAFETTSFAPWTRMCKHV
mmetsp:Transcript_10055/g.61062  ORF Transcript_10055/g.61062 Transcript_10055/m.61062 type:complete len:263 (-) Transcript_10055:606-1394(-)